MRIEGKTYSVTRIGDNACENFENIKHVNLPSSISYIGERAFGSCNGLESVSFYENEEIVVSDGNNDSALEELKKRASKICDIFFSKSNDESKLAQLQNEASKISKIKFENCKNTLEICKLAFCDCKSLKEIEIPQRVIKIGDRAFLFCEKLSKISLKNVKEIGENAFAFCNNLSKISLKNVKEIGDRAFQNCNNLSKISLKNVEKIGVHAFMYCNNLLEISLEGVKEIDDYAFQNCNNLSKISLKNVEKIGRCAFINTGIKEVLIPASVKVLGEKAFDTSSIKKIILAPESTLTDYMVRRAYGGGKYFVITIDRLKKA